MAEDALRKVCEGFGFERPNKHQEKALQLVIEPKGDVFVNLPTGFGKSVVFQALPAPKVTTGGGEGLTKEETPKL